MMMFCMAPPRLVWVVKMLVSITLVLCIYIWRWVTPVCLILLIWVASLGIALSTSALNFNSRVLGLLVCGSVVYPYPLI